MMIIGSCFLFADVSKRNSPKPFVFIEHAKLGTFPHSDISTVTSRARELFGKLLDIGHDLFLRGFLLFRFLAGQSASS